MGGRPGGGFSFQNMAAKQLYRQPHLKEKIGPGFGNQAPPQQQQRRPPQQQQQQLNKRIPQPQQQQPVVNSSQLQPPPQHQGKKPFMQNRQVMPNQMQQQPQLQQQRGQPPFGPVNFNRGIMPGNSFRPPPGPQQQQQQQFFRGGAARGGRRGFGRRFGNRGGMPILRGHRLGHEKRYSESEFKKELGKKEKEFREKEQEWVNKRRELENAIGKVQSSNEELRKQLLDNLDRDLDGDDIDNDSITVVSEDEAPPLPEEQGRRDKMSKMDMSEDPNPTFGMDGSLDRIVGESGGDRMDCSSDEISWLVDLDILNSTPKIVHKVLLDYQQELLDLFALDICSLEHVFRNVHRGLSPTTDLIDPLFDTLRSCMENNRIVYVLLGIIETLSKNGTFSRGLFEAISSYGEDVEMQDKDDFEMWKPMEIAENKKTKKKGKKLFYLSPLVLLAESEMEQVRSHFEAQTKNDFSGKVMGDGLCEPKIIDMIVREDLLDDLVLEDSRRVQYHTAKIGDSFLAPPAPNCDIVGVLLELFIAVKKRVDDYLRFMVQAQTQQQDTPPPAQEDNPVEVLVKIVDVFCVILEREYSSRSRRGFIHDHFKRVLDSNVLDEIWRIHSKSLKVLNRSLLMQMVSFSTALIRSPQMLNLVHSKKYQVDLPNKRKNMPDSVASFAYYMMKNQDNLEFYKRLVFLINQIMAIEGGIRFLLKIGEFKDVNQDIEWIEKLFLLVEQKLVYLKEHCNNQMSEKEKASRIEIIQSLVNVIFMMGNSQKGIFRKRVRGMKLWTPVINVYTDLKLIRNGEYENIKFDFNFRILELIKGGTGNTK